MFDPQNPVMAPRVWEVGALCRAVADALQARFNPVAVRGEITGFSRASSGHCYFSLKDAQGQIRCAMFRSAASRLDFVPRDGELVELRGRLGVLVGGAVMTGSPLMETLQSTNCAPALTQPLRLLACTRTLSQPASALRPSILRVVSCGSAPRGGS